MDSFLFEVEKKKKRRNDRKKAIAESMGIGPEYIRRARQRAAKLRMLLEEQKKNYGIEEH